MNPSNAIQSVPSQPSQACCAVPRATGNTNDSRSEWSYTPAIDVYETSDAYVIECDAPGVKPDAIDLTYDAGVLHVHGRAPRRQSPDAAYLRQEYGVGDFDREIPLGRLAEFVDGERLAAEYNHGVLTIRLPKLEFAQPKRINVKVN